MLSMRGSAPVEVIAAGNGCGEGVVWDSRRQALWWTDIPGRRLHRYDWASRSARVFDTPERVESFGLVAGSDQLITTFESGIALYNPYLGPDPKTVTWLARAQAGVKGVRFNDGRVDRRGRFWCGTMVEEDGRPETGNLYSIEGAQDVRCHVRGVRISNDLCMSPDGSQLYFADSPSRIIHVYDLNEPEGTLGPARHFAQSPQGALPDGAAVDAGGYLWSAHWGAAGVARGSRRRNARQGAPCRRYLRLPNRSPGASRRRVPLMTGRTSGNNLTYSIVQDLGTAIVTGTYSVTNPFPVEAELCRQYGASRTALREAVKMLTAKGLLGARPRQGTWVQPESKWNLLDPDILGWLLERKFSPALLLEFTEIRLAIEPAAAALAASTAGPQEKAAVRAAIDRMRAAERGEDDPLESDIAFHVAVLRASRNRFFAQLTELTATTLRFSIRTTIRYKGVQLASVADHKRVSDAIIAGKPAVAAEAMRKMIQEALELISGHDKRAPARRRAAIAES